MSYRYSDRQIPLHELANLNVKPIESIVGFLCIGYHQQWAAMLKKLIFNWVGSTLNGTNEIELMRVLENSQQKYFKTNAKFHKSNLSGAFVQVQLDTHGTCSIYDNNGIMMLKILKSPFLFSPSSIVQAE